MLSTQAVTRHVTAADLCDAFIHDGGKPATVKLQTVLLVDDDDMLRTVMEACLCMAGYGVIACHDAFSAVAAFGSGYVDILLTDLQMPGRSGLELARELTALRPTLPVLIISASMLSEETASEILERGWKFAAKPCRLPAVLGTIECLLSSRRHAAAWEF